MRPAIDFTANDDHEGKALVTSGTTLQQAVILAGGEGLRMRPLTEDRPKAMVAVGGIPIIGHQLRWLAENGIRHVVVACGYRAEVLRTYLDTESSRLGVDVIAVTEPVPLGRGGGLRFAAHHLRVPEERFLGLNGDVITRFQVNAFVIEHRRLGVAATLAVTRFRTTWGVVEMDGDLVRQFVQSPVLPYWGSVGIYCLEPEVVAALPERGDLEDSTLPSLAASGRLGAFRISETFLRCLDTVKDVRDTEAELSRLADAQQEALEGVNAY